MVRVRVIYIPMRIQIRTCLYVIDLYVIRINNINMHIQVQLPPIRIGHIQVHVEIQTLQYSL